jgi:hypothetical protein
MNVAVNKAKPMPFDVRAEASCLYLAFYGVCFAACKRLGWHALKEA